VPPVITLNFGRELRPPGPAIEDSEHSMEDVTRKLLRRRLGMNQEPDASILCGCVRKRVDPQVLVHQRSASNTSSLKLTRYRDISGSRWAFPSGSPFNFD
jgi:hypothetical protein